MKQDPNELAEVSRASAKPFEHTATYSALLIMENDSAIYQRLNALRRVDGTITANDAKRVFDEFKVQVDEWADDEVDFVRLAEELNFDIEPQSDVIMTALKTLTIAGNQAKLACQLDRGDYAKVDAILRALGGKWNKKAQAHVFESADPEEVIAEFIQTGKLDKPEKLGFFPTPKPLGREVVDGAGLEPGQLVLEPEAGIGNLASLIAEIVGHEAVTCYEIQQRNCEVLKGLGFKVVQADFLTVDPMPIFDAVVMNPPFEKQRDIDHVLHAFRFLKPGGSMTAIMSGGITYRTNRKTLDFRAFLDRYDASIEDNPRDAFHASGTSVATVTVRFRKPVAMIDDAPIVVPATPAAVVKPPEVDAPVPVVFAPIKTKNAQIGFDF